MYKRASTVYPILQPFFQKAYPVINQILEKDILDDIPEKTPTPTHIASQLKSPPPLEGSWVCMERRPSNCPRVTVASRYRGTALLQVSLIRLSGSSRLLFIVLSQLSVAGLSPGTIQASHRQFSLAASEFKQNYLLSHRKKKKKNVRGNPDPDNGYNVPFKWYPQTLNHVIQARNNLKLGRNWERGREREIITVTYAVLTAINWYFDILLWEQYSLITFIKRWEI